MNNRCAIYGDNYIFENAGQSENLSSAKNIVRDLIKSGINTFVTECDSKYELGLALYIARLKEKNPDVHLVVVRPFRDAISSSGASGVLNMVLGKADMVRNISETKEGFARTDMDKWIISHCDTVLHVRGESDTGETRLPPVDLTGKKVISIPDTGMEPGYGQGGLNNGIDLNEIVISAQQVPGRARFDNYKELRSYLERGLRQYNRTVYTLDNIEQARHDHFVLKTVRKKLTDVRRILKKGYTAPIDVVLEQLDELIGMVKEPYDTIDKLLKANARVIKEHDIMSYAGVQAVVLGKYSGSVLRSPAFFNPRWLNVSYKEAQWKSDINAIIEKASADIEYIVAHGENNTGAILGYYFDKLSLDGVENFLNNILREEVPHSPPASDPMFIDINTGEVVGQDFGEVGSDSDESIASLADNPADILHAAGSDYCSNEANTEEPAKAADDDDTPGRSHITERVGYDIEHRRVILSGNPAQIDKYIKAARAFGVEVKCEGQEDH